MPSKGAQRNGYTSNGLSSQIVPPVPTFASTAITFSEVASFRLWNSVNTSISSYQDLANFTDSINVVNSDT